MSGSMFLPDGREWHSNSSAYFWVLDALASRATDPGLAAYLRERFDANVGFLGVDDLPESQRAELLALIGQLPAVARAIAADEAYRDSFIAQMDELAGMVR
ncbi:hypothetical protein [Cellulomonas sp. URHD0024]|uniref:hypothetical protein n=1 Tax=Cellulomonas sp. URHD0024 TaxID=1302620 RepID=UPI000426BAD9|nr:hypothetical protein [Cellulomonas sp. URHD0024]